MARSSLEEPPRVPRLLHSFDDRLRPRDLVTASDPLTHVSANLSGVASGALRDAPLLSGLLIAAAGAAGLTAVGAPLIRVAPTGGVSAVLLLDPCHVSIHSFPDRGLALVDVLARDAAGGNKALDVFVRRLAPTAVGSDVRTRG
jgi:S-adenosylmethionine decarboxylase